MTEYGSASRRMGSRVKYEVSFEHRSFGSGEAVE